MRLLLPLLVLTAILSGCVRNNPLPVWLEINEWTLKTNPLSTQNPGELTHNFTDVWVYIDEKLIGVFEVPCKIPVIVEGNKSVRLYPTVRNNGISATKKIYPFVEPFEKSFTFVPGETITIDPETNYYTSVQFWIEDFESGASFQIDTDNSVSNATIVRENDASIALSGDYGHIALTSSDSLWVGITTAALQLPQGGKEVYLELDYRNTNSILTGVLAITPNGIKDNPNISLNAQDASSVKWKKIYIDLKEIVSSSTTATGFKQYLRTLLPESTSNADVYIDNLKIVHF